MRFPRVQIDNILKVNKSMDRTAIREKMDAARTKLANERTLLSYVRTSLALVVGGITFIRFFDYRIVEIMGWVFIPIGLANLVVGIMSYRATKEHINEIDHV